MPPAAIWPRTAAESGPYRGPTGSKLGILGGHFYPARRSHWLHYPRETLHEAAPRPFCFVAREPRQPGGRQWRLIGPFRGGRVLAVSGVRGDPQHFYFGSVDGGVWETRDAGRTWQPIFDAMHVGSIGALAVAPSNPKVIYVGSGEADMRSDIGYGNGMYKSTDAGKTWTHIGLEDTMQIGKILVDPSNPDVVFVAALGHAYGPNAMRGVFRSTDGGQTWKKALYKDEDT